MFKRTISVLLILALLSLCGGCKQKTSSGSKPSSDKETTAEVIKTRDITLLYCQADTINPYTCGTKYNQELCDLLYDPLIKLDEAYAVKNCLAEAIEASPSSVLVVLKNATFSNGATLNANDIVYSFNLAKNLTQYASAFAQASCTADGNAVRFQLSSPDTAFVNFLDFPIIQAGSDTLKDSDNILQPPVGCGRYIYQYGQSKLTANPNYHGGKVNIKNINLIDTPDSTAANHHLEVGSVDYYYSTLADGVIPKLNGTSRQVILNKLVYIGINQNSNMFKNPQMRQTLSAAINRTALVNNAFHSDAVVAKTPFHPLWKAAEGYEYIEEKENIDVVLANLKEIGYNTKDNEGYFVNSRGSRLSFSLLCPSSDASRVMAAEHLKSQLKKIGIALNVEVVSFAQFTARLSGGSYQLYLSEVQIPQNMDISSFTVAGGSIAYGVVDGTITTASEVTSTEPVDPQNTETASKNLSQAIAEYKAEQSSLFDVVTIFNASMPIIPICFKSGISVYASDFEIAPYATISDVFYNIENATFK